MTGMAPLLVRLASALFGDDIAERTFAPLLADWQHEWHAAASRRQRAVVLWRGCGGLLTTAAMVATHLARPWDLPRGDRRGIAITFLGYASVGAVAGLSPFVLIPIVAGPLRLALLATLAPAMLAVALPVALLPTAAAIERRSRQRWPLRGPWLLATVCALSMTALVVHVGWLVPAANAEFQARAAGAATGRAWAPPRGVKELTAPELIGQAAPTDIEARVTTAGRRKEALLRLSLATLWPVTFAVFGWRLSRHRRVPSRSATAGWWCVAVVSTLLVSFGLLGPGAHRLPSVVATACAWLLAAALFRPAAALGEAAQVRA